MDIKDSELKIVIDTIKNTLGTKATIYLFGSRVNNTAKKYSDLDIALDNGTKITLEQLANIKDNFDTSDLPYPIDIVDLNNIDDNFKKVVLSNCIALKQT